MMESKIISTINTEKIIVKILNDDAKEFNKILRRKTAHPDYGRDSVIDVITVEFSNGYQADIKICNGNGPYIDPVLFDADGEELTTDAVTDTILGKFVFTDNESESIRFVYIVEIISA